MPKSRFVKEFFFLKKVFVLAVRPLRECLFVL